MLDWGLSCAKLLEHTFFRSCIAGGIHVDLFQTAFSGVIPSIGLFIVFLPKVATKAHCLLLGHSTTSGVQLRVSVQSELLIRGPLINAIELKWYREYIFVPPDVYAMRSFS